MYSIEKNVPMPLNNKAGRPSKYPLSKMKVGDSFLIPFSKNHDCTRSISVPYLSASRLKIKITSRVEQKGVRVWRIK